MLEQVGKNPQPELLSSGNEALDQFLGGGFEKDIITTIYGPAGSGKTNLVLLTLVEQIRNGKQVIYIDTEGSFSVARVMQLCPEFASIADQVLFLRPTNFEEQKKAFDALPVALNEKKDVGMIIVDSIAMLYRLEIGKNNDVYTVNKELGRQLGLLTEITRKQKIPILITNQVYADFEQKEVVKMVGGDLLKYSSKCLIELKKAAGRVRVAQLRKHRSIGEGKEFAFTIINEGIIETEITQSRDDEELL